MDIGDLNYNLIDGHLDLCLLMNLDASAQGWTHGIQMSSCVNIAAA